MSTASIPSDPASASAQARRRAGRFAYCITGSGHELETSLALAARLPDCDLFLSGAAEEVLPMYGRRLEALKTQQGLRIFRDKTASSVPVGTLYQDGYHTVVIAPATSNTVAKCAYGISDSLPTNMYAQAGKLGIPSIVFACDTEPVVVTRAPHDWVTLRPRRIEFENVERLRGFEVTTVAASAAELEAALAARLAELGLSWKPGAGLAPAEAELPLDLAPDLAPDAGDPPPASSPS